MIYPLPVDLRLGIEANQTSHYSPTSNLPTDLQLESYPNFFSRFIFFGGKSTGFKTETFNSVCASRYRL